MTWMEGDARSGRFMSGIRGSTGGSMGIEADDLQHFGKGGGEEVISFGARCCF